MAGFEYTQVLWAPWFREEYWNFVRDGWTLTYLGPDWLKPGYFLYGATKIHS